jgi:hypothetical protein
MVRAVQKNSAIIGDFKILGINWEVRMVRGCATELLEVVDESQM